MEDLTAGLLCPHCISLLVKKFNEVDVLVLIFLADEQTAFVNGMKLSAIHEKLNQKEEKAEEEKGEAQRDLRPTKDQIYWSLNKLAALTFVDYYKATNTFHYYITQNGRDALECIQVLSSV